MSIILEPFLDIAKDQAIKHLPGAEFASKTLEVANDAALSVAEKLPIIGPMIKKGVQLFDWGEDKISTILTGARDEIEKKFGIGSAPENAVTDVNKHTLNDGDFQFDKKGFLDSIPDRMKNIGDAEKQAGAEKAQKILEDHATDTAKNTVDELFSGGSNTGTKAKLRSKLELRRPDGSINMKVINPIDVNSVINKLDGITTDQELDDLLEDSGLDIRNLRKKDGKVFKQIKNDFRELRLNNIDEEEFKFRTRQELGSINPDRLTISKSLGRGIKGIEHKPLRNFLLGTQDLPEAGVPFEDEPRRIGEEPKPRLEDFPDDTTGERRVPTFGKPELTPDRIVELNNKIKEIVDSNPKFKFNDKSLFNLFKDKTDEEISNFLPDLKVLDKIKESNNILTNQEEFNDDELIKLSNINTLLDNPVKSRPSFVLGELKEEQAGGVGLDNEELEKILNSVSSKNNITIDDFKSLGKNQQEELITNLKRLNRPTPFNRLFDSELRTILSLGEDESFITRDQFITKNFGVDGLKLFNSEDVENLSLEQKIKLEEINEALGKRKIPFKDEFIKEEFKKKIIPQDTPSDIPQDAPPDIPQDAPPDTPIESTREPSESISILDKFFDDIESGEDIGQDEELTEGFSRIFETLDEQEQNEISEMTPFSGGGDDLRSTVLKLAEKTGQSENDIFKVMRNFFNKIKNKLLTNNNEYINTLDVTPVNALNTLEDPALSNEFRELFGDTDNPKFDLSDLTDESGTELLSLDETAEKLKVEPSSLSKIYDNIKEGFKKFKNDYIDENENIPEEIKNLTIKEALLGVGGTALGIAGIALSLQDKEAIQKLEGNVDKALDNVGAPKIVKDITKGILRDMRKYGNKQTKQFQDTLNKFIKEEMELKLLQGTAQRALQIFNQPSTSVITNNEHEESLKQAETEVQQKEQVLEERLKQIDKQGMITKNSIDKQKEEEIIKKSEDEIRKKVKEVKDEQRIRKVEETVQKLPKELEGVIRPQLKGDSIKSPVNVNIINRVQSPTNTETGDDVNDGIIQKNKELEESEDKPVNNKPANNILRERKEPNPLDNREFSKRPEDQTKRRLLI